MIFKRLFNRFKKEIIINEYIKKGFDINLVHTEEEIIKIRQAFLKDYESHETNEQNTYWAADFLINSRLSVIGKEFEYMARALYEPHGAAMLLNRKKDLNKFERMAAFYKVLESSLESQEVYFCDSLSSAQKEMLLRKILQQPYACVCLIKQSVIKDKDQNIEFNLSEEVINRLMNVICNDPESCGYLLEKYTYRNDEEGKRLVQGIANGGFNSITHHIGIRFYPYDKKDWEIIGPILIPRLNEMDEYTRDKVDRYIKYAPEEYQIMFKLIA